MKNLLLNSKLTVTSLIQRWCKSFTEKAYKTKKRRKKMILFKYSSAFSITLIYVHFIVFLFTDITSYLSSIRSSHPCSSANSSLSSSIFLFTSATSVITSSSAISAFSSSSLDDYFDSSAVVASLPILTPSAFTSSVNGPSGSGSNQQCPPVCSCIWKSGKQTATCDRRGLVAVPLGLVGTTQVVDLSGNSLHTLPANVFLERGLTNLQRIYLVDCQLRKLIFCF